MIDKTLKILKVIFLTELLVWLSVIVIKNYYPTDANASSYKAHNSADSETLILTVTEMSLEPESGSSVTIWKGSQEIDLASASSLKDIFTFNCDIPSGKYKKFKIYCGTNYPKVKGSVVVDGKTYYTKAAHTGFETGPAEVEEIRPWGYGTGGFGLEQYFSTAIDLGGAVPEIRVLIDLSYYLLYYDGDKTTSNGYDPMGSENYINTGGKPGMFLGELPFAFAIGKPGKKETYEYSTPAWTSSPGKGRLTLLFDSSDNLIGGFSKILLIDNGGTFFKIYGSLSNQYGSSGVSPDAFKKNADGTYSVKMDSTGAGAITGAHTDVFSNFKRETHEGNFTHINYTSGTDLTVTETTTGTYSCTRIQ